MTQRLLGAMAMVAVTTSCAHLSSRAPGTPCDATAVLQHAAAVAREDAPFAGTITADSHMLDAPTSYAEVDYAAVGDALVVRSHDQFTLVAFPERAVIEKLPPRGPDAQPSPTVQPVRAAIDAKDAAAYSYLFPPPVLLRRASTDGERIAAFASGLADDVRVTSCAAGESGSEDWITLSASNGSTRFGIDRASGRLTQQFVELQVSAGAPPVRTNAKYSAASPQLVDELSQIARSLGAASDGQH